MWHDRNTDFVFTKMSALAALAMAALVLAGCSRDDLAGAAEADSGAEESASETSEPEQNASETDESEESETAEVPLVVSVTAHGENTLRALVQVETSADAPVHVQIEADGIAPRTISSNSTLVVDQTVSTNEAGRIHEFTVIGLRAQTTYQFTAWSTSPDEHSEPVEFTTGSLPSSAPTIEITQTAATTDTAGITFVGLRNVEDGPSYFGFDSQGHVVWYLDSDERTGGDPYIRHVGDGTILAMFSGLVQHMTLSGEVLEEYDLSGIDGWHHDVRILDDGGALLLTRQLQMIDGQEILGDSIVEIDRSGDVIWEWSTFDHLDISRFPGELATTEARAGGTDWTHANSIWIDEDSGQMLVSLRSQGWVVSIDRSTSEILWIAGDDAGTASDFEANFLNLQAGTWTTGQHAAMFSGAGELLVYDNRNESGGETDLSRAVIYAIDTDAATATQVFEASAGKYTTSLGDVDELANGNILISAGGSGNRDRDGLVTEVNRAGGVVWQARLTGNSFYRAERVAWTDMSASIATTSTTDNPEQVEEQIEENEPTNEATETASGQVDITNVTLTNTQASCAAYAGDYSSQITDVSRDVAFEGSLTLRVDGNSCILETNSIPNHDVGEGSSFANDIDEVSASYTLPLNPEIASSPTPIGSDAAGVILLNGVVWESYPAACFDFGNGTRLGLERIGCPGNVDHPWRYNIGSPLNEFGVDAYFAHPQGDGYYHYHKTPIALYEPACEGVSASPVIGFAKDGFPVFGPCFTAEDGTVRTAQSSHQLRQGEREDVAGYTTPYVVGAVASTQYDGQFMGDFEFVAGSGDLDECNGMTVDGVYGYYLTSTYPFVIGCYSGTPTAEANFGRTGTR